VIDELVDAGHPVKVCCRLLGVSSPGYYQYKNRPLSPTAMRRQWLTGLIREVHTASRGTYGSRRVHAELTRGMDIVVSENLVAVLMGLAGIAGLPGPAKVKKLKGIATADDLVHRKFHRLAPNELWVTDITEHPTREGKIYCCAVLDAFSRFDRRLVHRQPSGFLPGGQRPGHGDHESSAGTGRDRARRPRGAVHVLGQHLPYPGSGSDALVWNDR
jgi:hypothetical protein